MSEKRDSHPRNGRRSGARQKAASLPAAPWSLVVTGAIGVALAIALRYSLLDFKSLDYFASLKPWYNTIRSNGFAAFATPFSTYNPPYLYILYVIARFLPDLPTVVAVKLPGLLADFICAGLVYRTVALRLQARGGMPLVAGLVVLYAPSIVLNSAFWGQADSLLAAGLLACTFFLMTHRPGFAMLAFGVALAFKLQAIFLVPVLIALGLRGTIPWKSFLIVPAVLCVALLPALIAGRPIAELVGVYLFQATQFEVITLNAASVYAWLPGSKQVFNLFYGPGVIMGAAAAFFWCVFLLKSPRSWTAALTLEISLMALLVVPFFLPKMHDRYFYPADILSIALAFFYPQLYYIPIIVGGVSFLSYQPFLFERDLVPLPILASAMLVTIGILFYHSATQLYEPLSPKPPQPVGAPGRNSPIASSGRPRRPKS